MERKRGQQPGLTKREHHAFGALLKRVEAIALAYRYGRYPKSSKTGRKFDRLISAIRALRPWLDHELSFVARQPHGSDAYFGQEVRDAQLLTYWLEARMRGEPPPEQEEFITAIENLAAAGRHRLPQLFWDAAPRALKAPSQREISAARKIVERRDAVRAALLANPDQPQAVFVKRCRVHPDTVRRTRRELEEAGVIPFLAHRHSNAAQRKRRAQEAEAAE
jgi:hypothetical protein